MTLARAHPELPATATTQGKVQSGWCALHHREGREKHLAGATGVDWMCTWSKGHSPDKECVSGVLRPRLHVGGGRAGGEKCKPQAVVVFFSGEISSPMRCVSCLLIG